jgi:alpha-ribazole phosphatase
MDLVLIRHTKVDTEEGVCYGRTDVGLAPSFEKEKKVIQKKLPHGGVDVIFSSPLSRCKQLAESLFPNKEIIYDERLIELNFGDWEGLHWDDIATSEEAEAFFNDYINTPCPGGESYQDMLKRVTEFYNEIKDKYEKVVIVSHGGPIRALLCIIENITPKEAFERKVEYGEVIKLKIEN